jgi:hypothetical protein
MTRERCIEMLPIIIAFAGGETLEVWDWSIKKWVVQDNIGFGAFPKYYRIVTLNGKYIYFDKDAKNLTT